ncbi:acyl dehydratase [Rhodococcus sp. 15-649-2-2]|uniref:MaoC family dehydratase n=1 Tax=Rhodococcus sp. 15-649-2-2 TaxID=2023140 RepID=UPI000B9A58D6|nr:acyl dehydratase [Rhodococcus sp. 15-649-2-2]
MSVVGERLTTERSPFFDELTVGQVFDTAPAVTLTEGMAAVHQSIVGNRFALSLDRQRARTVTGGPLASPALVWDVSIGQSTPATQHVRANLFYRGLFFYRLPAIGDTLRTKAVVEALRENARKAPRTPTGLAVLRITTVDQRGRTVLDYRRCAMLLLSPGAPPTDKADDIATVNDLPVETDMFASITDWDIAGIPRSTGMPSKIGTELRVLGGDVVSSAPELARLTGNVARVHHDSAAGGGSRLVYGGHTIGLAFHHVCQALPGIVAVAGWHGCDHLAAVHEGDVLASTVAIESVTSHASGVDALGLKVTTSRRHADGKLDEVLAWRPIVLVR